MIDLDLDVKIVEREPIKVLSMRNMSALQKFEERYVKLYREAFSKRLQVTGAPIAIYHGPYFDGELNDVEVALPVNKDEEGVKEIPGGKYACVVHNGPYGTLPITYALLGAWLAKSEYRISGAPYDVYVRGGNDKILTQDQYLTEIYLPLMEEVSLDDFDFGSLVADLPTDTAGQTQ
ncbi:MAG: GyrI-like domain-containing protein [Oscillospiraceae bacterium]|nr:GyrI-like domain-containing protein [Oscillospiraceae bacterium]